MRYLVTAVALSALVYGGLSILPDIKRYWRIKTM
jgi:Ni/Fe-hydrogenase subunit HybB-like protein